MTQEEITLYEIKKVVDNLDPETRQAVITKYQELKAMVGNDPIARAAYALLGAELAIESK